MTKENDGFSCALGSWAMAAGAAFLAFVLLIVLGGYGFYGAAFLAAVIFAALGALFSWIFCGRLPRPGSVKPGVEGGLRTYPPKNFEDVSVTYAHAKRRAEAEGRPPPPNPYEDKTQTAPAARATAAPVVPPTQTSDPAVAASAPAIAKSELSRVEATKPDTAEAETTEPDAPKPNAPAEAADTAPPAATASAASSETEGGTRPALLDAPREGGADDLKKIKGVGPKLEQALNGMGVYHFDQIAGWSADEIAWMDENLVQFKGRVSRDDWVAQAKDLAGA